MTKQQFLDELGRALVSLKVQDADEIVTEYQEHFEFKLADGYAEEEIAARIGDPKTIAKSFADVSEKTSGNAGKKLIVLIGLVCADLFAVCFFLLLFAWVIVLGALAVASLVLAGYFICNANLSSLIPPIPYGCKLLGSVPLLALTVLCAAGAFYSFLYCRQLLRAYLRWHKNMYAQASNQPVLPSLAKYPQLSAATKRGVKRVFSISLVGLGISLILVYLVFSVTAGSLEFWHAWNWFQR